MDRVTLLLDGNTFEGRSLLNTLQQVGYEVFTLAVEDDGFLPEGITSVYGMYLGDFSQDGSLPQKPRYFNQIDRPDYWEISGTGQGGRVSDGGRERGRIFYAEPQHKRLVRQVHWLDEAGNVRASDHYNKYGALFARTVCNAKGARVTKTYYDVAGQEKIVENFVTGNIILNDEGKTFIYKNKTEFIAGYLKKKGLDEGRIFYNSLSTPFFVTLALEKKGEGDVLFWQEGEREDIPGNMQAILDGGAPRTRLIVAQNRRAFYKLRELSGDNDMLTGLGYIYPFKRSNQHRREAMICTNSDQVEQLKTLVEALPELHFNVLAITEMSSKLMAFDDYENVSLYPGVKTKKAEELFGKCDIYLDINHANEILDAVREAFLNDQIIYAFDELAHNRDFTARKNIYKIADTEKLITAIRQILSDGEMWETCLRQQKIDAMAETKQSFTLKYKI